MTDETILDELNEDDLKKLLIQLDSIINKSEDEAHKPKTDDELHNYIKRELGLDVPRVAVCPHHNAPFEIIADLFFNRVDAAILVAGRGGGKTMSAALWQFLNMKFIPEVECASVGAVDIQAKRAYQHFKTFQRKAAQELVVTSLLSETIWNQEQKYEVLTGSINSVNGPHPQKVHRDEVDLMDKKVFQESLQMEKSKKTSEGEVIPRQTLITSTRKTTDGLMQELLDSVEEAISSGRRPPYKVYTYCIKEVVENQPTCRVAFPDLPDEQKCDCDTIQKGEWSEDEPRTLDTVCNGLFAKSQGFVPLSDLQVTFATTSKAMWDAQQECKRPYSEDVSIEAWAQERHGIRSGFEPDPDNGPIYQGIDFGGSSPHAAIWGQILEFEIEVFGYDGQPKRIPEGSLVIFHEVYLANVGNIPFADAIVDAEREFKRKWPKFRVRGRFADPQASAAKKDFRDHAPPLLCTWPTVTRDREEHFKRLNQRVKDDLFYAVLDACPMFVEQVEVWNILNTGKKKTFDHSIDATLYLASNIEKVTRDNVTDIPEIQGRRKIGPGIPNQFDDTVPGSRPSELHVEKLPDSEQWRMTFGLPQNQ